MPCARGWVLLCLEHRSFLFFKIRPKPGMDSGPQPSRSSAGDRTEEGPSPPLLAPALPPSSLGIQTDLDREGTESSAGDPSGHDTIQAEGEERTRHCSLPIFFAACNSFQDLGDVRE